MWEPHAAAPARASMISSYAFLSNSVETRNTSYSCPKVLFKDTASRRLVEVNQAIYAWSYRQLYDENIGQIMARTPLKDVVPI